MIEFDEPFIFVSYARKDLEVVRPEIERIESYCYKVWYDIGDLIPGYTWEEYIEAAIERCSCFVVFITRVSVESVNVMGEIKKALACKKPIICIYWEQEKFSSPLQDELDKIQALERYTFSTPDYEERLTRALPKGIKRTELKKPDWHNKPDSGSDKASGISPKAIFFTLILLSVFFFLFGLVAMAAPLFAAQEPNDPLNNPLAGVLTGLFFIAIAAGLAVWAFIVHRQYLKEER
jgi:hypothetical protein